jgi:hypothetical protein
MNLVFVDLTKKSKMPNLLSIERIQQINWKGRGKEALSAISM